MRIVYNFKIPKWQMWMHLNMPKKKEMKEENIVDALTVECGFWLIIEADGKFMYTFSSLWSILSAASKLKNNHENEFTNVFFSLVFGRI